MTAHTILLDEEPAAAKDRTGLVYDDGKLRITAIKVDHAPIEPAYAPDKFLTRRLFSQAVNDVRRNGWAIAEDGSLYTLPIGSDKIERGKIG